VRNKRKYLYLRRNHKFFDITALLCVKKYFQKVYGILSNKQLAHKCFSKVR